MKKVQKVQNPTYTTLSLTRGGGNWAIIFIQSSLHMHKNTSRIHTKLATVVSYTVAGLKTRQMKTLQKGVFLPYTFYTFK